MPELRDEKTRATAAWGIVYPTLLWEMYSFYGDERILREHYENVKSWYRYLINSSDDFILDGRWGDHNAPGIKNGKYLNRGTTPEFLGLLNTASLYRINKLLQKISGQLNRPDDKKKYRLDAENIYSRFNKSFYSKQLKRYFENHPPEGFENLHTSNLIPLQMELVPDTLQSHILDVVLSDIEKRGYRSFTGVLGTKALVDVLQKEQKFEFLTRIIEQNQFPGWKYTLDQGATSLWQSWNGEEDFIHAMFGSVNEFFYENILGIHLDSLSEKHISIRPRLPENLQFARGQVGTIFGIVKSEWRKAEEGLEVKITIPHNTNGNLVIDNPGKRYRTITEQSRLVYEEEMLISKVEGVKSVESKEGKLILRLGSGSYHFQFNK